MSYPFCSTHCLSATSLKTTAAPVFAQAAIQEPGAFSFYHPDLDILNGGAPTPAARLILELPHAAREIGTRLARAARHRSYRR
jgi:hypothetical protein